MLSEHLLPAINAMIGDLESQRLEVSLAPAKYGDGYVRVVESTNPEWYQRLCAGHTKTRTNKRKRRGKKHHDTKIKRERILGVLRTLATTGSSTSKYVGELLGYAGEIAEEIAAMAAAYEDAELDELGVSRSQYEQMAEAPF